MRDYFEKLEYQILAPFAIKSKESKGRAHNEIPSQTRTCFQRDRDRIIHSKAFRRLKHKTQVFIASYSDHSRSRLTHTIEVAQISRHLARLLKVNEDLCECIALAHDLGHTPYGHSGEKELNHLMKNHGGFEHNQQSLRIIEHLEEKYPQFPGLNLSFEIREGLRKHETPWDHPKQSSERAFITIESQIANVADEIAYNNHDIDDGLTSGLLIESELENQVTLWKEAKKIIQKKYTSLENRQLYHLINSYLISSQVIDVTETSQINIKSHHLESIETLQNTRTPFISFSKEMHSKNRELRKFLFDNFYKNYSVYRMNKQGQLIIQKLFQAFKKDQYLLPQKYQEKLKLVPVERVICDYIAGMTDTFAEKEYQSIYF